MGKIIDTIETFFLNLLEKLGLKSLVKFYRDHQEEMRYLVFGVLTTLVNVIVYGLCFYIIKINNGISNGLAWVISVTFAYITNKYYVFNSKVKTKKALIYEISSFYGCRLLTFVVDEILMILTVNKFGFNALLMKVIVNIIIIILNFVLSKVIIFKKSK